MDIYIDFFHSRGFLKDNPVPYLKALDKRKEFHDVYFVKEPYLPNMDIYKRSYTLSNKAFGIYIPYKDIREKINTKHNGCNTCTSYGTERILNTIKKHGFEVRYINTEFDTFINSKLTYSNNGIIAITNDSDIYLLSGYFDTLFVNTIYGVRDGKPCKRSNFDEFLFEVFYSFIFGRIKDNVIGVIYNTLIKEYPTRSVDIVDAAPLENGRLVLNHIQKSINLTLGRYLLLSNFLTEKKPYIVNYLRKKLDTYDIKEILEHCYHLAYAFVEKYAKDCLEYMSNDYANYISELCYNVTLFE